MAKKKKPKKKDASSAEAEPDADAVVDTNKKSKKSRKPRKSAGRTGTGESSWSTGDPDITIADQVRRARPAGFNDAWLLAK